MAKSRVEQEALPEEAGGEELDLSAEEQAQLDQHWKEREEVTGKFYKEDAEGVYRVIPWDQLPQDLQDAWQQHADLRKLVGPLPGYPQGSKELGEEE